VNVSSQGGNQLSEDLHIPFRVLPIRGTRFGESTILIACAALSVAAWVLAVSLGHAVSAAELIAVSLLFGPFLAVLGFLLIRHQRRHFGADSRYWLKIDREQLTIVTPDNEDTYDWRNVTRFVVEKDERTTMDTEKHVENSVTVYVTAVDAGPNSRRITIVADDFAGKLPGNQVERAQKFCAILNDLRAWAADSTNHVLSRRSISGLAVATN
jgi:hypothetical protein